MSGRDFYLIFCILFHLPENHVYDYSKKSPGVPQTTKRVHNGNGHIAFSIGRVRRCGYLK